MTPEAEHITTMAHAMHEAREEGRRMERERLRVRLEMLRDKIDGGKYEDAGLLIEMILSELFCPKTSENR